MRPGARFKITLAAVRVNIPIPWPLDLPLYFRREISKRRASNQTLIWRRKWGNNREGKRNKSISSMPAYSLCQLSHKSTNHSGASAGGVSRGLLIQVRSEE